MATTLYATSAPASTHRGTNTARLDGTATGWTDQALSTGRGTGVSSLITATVTGATNGVEVNAGTASSYNWISEPLAAGATIAGTVTCNIWAVENNMSANVAINVVVDKISATDQAITQVLKTARVIELTIDAALTTFAVNNFTATPTSTVFNRGDRIRVRLFGDDVGTMATGFQFAVAVSGTTGGASGDSFVTFTENLTFESAPAGDTLYLRSVTAGINPGAATELEAWKTRGSASTSVNTSTVTGWTAPFQVGSPALEWYSRPLSAFTLAGMAQLTVRAGTDTGGPGCASLRGELAVCASDGSSPVVFAVGGLADSGVSFAGRLSQVSEESRTMWLAGGSVAVTNQQRLRVRVYVDDNAEGALSSGATVTITYDGPTANAAGDSYLTLPQTVTEYGVATPLPRRLQASKHPIHRASVW